MSTESKEVKSINIELEGDEMEALNKADYLHVNGTTFVRQSKTESLMEGFFKLKAVEFLDWFRSLPEEDRCGYGQVLLTSKELIDKFSKT
jgi:hypothetical protein